MNRRLIGMAAAGVVALAATGCGDDERAALTDTQRTSSPGLTEPPATIAPDPTTSTSPRTKTEEEPDPGPTHTDSFEPDNGGVQAPEEQEGGAGDESAARSKVTLAIDGARVTPRQSRVPAFLGVALTLRSRDGAPHSVRIATVPGQFEARAGGATTSNIDGLQPGTYAVLVDGRATDAVLRVGNPG